MNLEAVIAGLPGFSIEQVERQLPTGLTHQSYVLRQNERRFVLRLDLPGAAALQLQRDREYRLCAAIEGQGLCPPWLEWDAAQGWGLREWWEGQSWQTADLQDEANLLLLAALLQRLHSATPPAKDLAAPVDRNEPLTRYASHLGTAEAKDWRQRGEDCLQKLSTEAGVVAICHNDLVCHNVLVNRNQVPYLIDFEFSAVGDAWFDLATVLEHHRLSKALSKVFLQAYLGRAMTANESARLLLWQKYYRCLLELWQLRIDHLA